MSLAYRHPFTESWFVPADGEWGNNAPWRSYPPHAGVDYNIVGGSAGKTIRAIAEGTIRGKGWHTNYGNRVYIEHDDGMWSHYAHMQAPSSKNDGDRVTLGTPIGLVGNTGLSFGAHLHLEMATTAGRCHDGNTSIDPIKFINNNPGETPEPEEPVPFYNHKQSTAALNFVANTTYYATFNGVLVTNPASAGDTNLAGTAAGGAGLYNLDIPLYFTGLTAGASVTVNLVVQDIATGSLDNWYLEKYEGNASGDVRVNHTAQVVVPANKRLFLRVTPTVNVRLDVWGRKVTNYQTFTS